MPYDRFSPSTPKEASGARREDRRGRASRRRRRAAYLQRRPLGCPALPLRPGPDRHDDHGGRLRRLRGAGPRRAAPDRAVARGGGSRIRACAPRAVLPAASGGLRRLEPHLGGDLPGASPRADDHRDRLHGTRHARRGRGHRGDPVVKVVIAGAGVAGLCTAYYLRKRDGDVTVLESRTVCSPAAASYGNGGWITPAQAGGPPRPGGPIYTPPAPVKTPPPPLF